MPEGATVVFSAHGVSPEVHEQAAERSLKTIDATCPLVTKVHHEAKRFAERGLRHPADRPRRPRGGRGHRGRGARPHPAGAEPRRRGRASRSATRRRWPGSRRPRSRSTRRWRPSRRSGSASRSCSTRRSDDICYATQNRQLAVKEIARGRRPGDRGRLRQLLQLGAAGRGRARGRRQGGATASTTPARSTRPGSRASRPVSVTSGASRARGPRRRACWRFLAERGYPDAQAVHTRRGVADLRAAAGAAPRPARGRQKS